ncbi:hypothetical protein BC829DRAFT_380431 [Chytridium lagenaria]|nr:hypothetical protein BC829DRAFT_380431 [Chytridium lagenaria]
MFTKIKHSSEMKDDDDVDKDVTRDPTTVAFLEQDMKDLEEIKPSMPSPDIEAGKVPLRGTDTEDDDDDDEDDGSDAGLSDEFRPGEEKKRQVLERRSSALRRAGSDRGPKHRVSLERKSTKTSVREGSVGSVPYYYPSKRLDTDTKKDPLTASMPGSIPNSSISIGLSRFPNAKELGESINVKVLELTKITLVVILNSMLIALAYGLKHGITMGLAPNFVRYAGGVFLEIILLIANILTIMAVDAGASIYMAGLLTNSKKGYSMAAFGFMHSSPFLRLSFTDQLSLSSPCRKFLHRAAYVWLLLEAAKLLSPLGATGVATDVVYSNAAPMTCIRLDSVDLADRGFPTLETSQGVSEFLFGSALGCMRSEMDCGVPRSVFVTGPQLNGAVNSGDTIEGAGYQADIASNCKCYNISSPLPAARGLLYSDEIPNIMSAARSFRTPFVYHGRVENITSNAYSGVFVLGNINGCGGYSDSLVSICSTTISNIANVEKTLKILQEQTVNVTDIMFALDAMMGPGSFTYLPSTVPGMLSPLLYWMSTDLLSVNPTYISAGMEASIAILLRAGMQRTFSMSGITCPRFIARDDMVKVLLKGWGYSTLYASSMVQLLFSFAALGFGSTWLWLKRPITPALRALKEPTYFMTLLADSPFSANLAGTANAPAYVFWQALDLIVKIGESVDTLSEPIGHLRMERAKFVRPLSNGKAYY